MDIVSKCFLYLLYFRNLDISESCHQSFDTSVFNVSTIVETNLTMTKKCINPSAFGHSNNSHLKHGQPTIPLSNKIIRFETRAKVPGSQKVQVFHDKFKNLKQGHLCPGFK
jgi:hypothetical protein